MEIWQILTIALGLLTILFGAFWGKAKLVVKQLKVILTVISEAIEDDEITREELKLINEEIKRLIELFKSSDTEKVSDKYVEIKNRKKKSKKK